MSRVPRYHRLLDKSLSAMVSAIEVYNKPDHKYREENFSILVVNAWELLFKAKLLKNNGNDLRSLYVYEPRTRKGGGLSTTRTYVKKNRAGAPYTLSLGGAMEKVRDTDPQHVDDVLRDNIFAVVEVRDNAAHYLNVSPELAREVLELGTATIQNYVRLCREWFQRDLSEYHLFLMPLGFVAPSSAKAIAMGTSEKHLVEFIRRLRMSHDDGKSDHCFSLSVDISFSRSRAPGTSAVRVTTDPSAPEVRLSDEQFLERWPWEHAELVKKLKDRYSDFKQSAAFFSILKPLKTDQKYARARRLNPRKASSAQQIFYSTAVLEAFDKHYSRK